MGMRSDKRADIGGREAFGERLRRARASAGMSQRDLERASGIPKSRISRYENGHLLPSINGLQRLSTSLGIQDAALLGGPDDPYAVFAAVLHKKGIRFSSTRDAEKLAERVAGEIRRITS